MIIIASMPSQRLRSGSNAPTSAIAPPLSGVPGLFMRETLNG
ncbi:MAG: hypothetical protein ACE5GA_05630 [Candidatus Zixiibacteriota bacterium]